MSLSTPSELRLQQIDSCVNDLVIQAQNIRHLLNICIQHEKVEKLNNVNLYQDNEIPENLLHLPIIKSKTKKYICKYANEQGVGNAAQAYSLPQGLVEKWLFENAIIGKIKDDKSTKITQLNPQLNTQLSTQNNGVIGERKRTTPDILLYNNNEENSANKLKTPKSPKIDQNTPRYPITETENTKYPNTKGISCYLSLEEKSRIAYDYIAIGISTCERKWGLTRQNISYFIKSKHLFDTEVEKEEWMSEHAVIIKERLKSMIEINIYTIKSRVEEILNSGGNNNNINYIYNYNTNATTKEHINYTPIPLSEVLTLSFEKGIALIAVKYKINLFDLEYLLQYHSSSRWQEMEHNEWYLVDKYEYGEQKPCVEEVVNLAITQGYLYAGKRYRMPADMIRKNLCKYYQRNCNSVVNCKSEDNIEIS